MVDQWEELTGGDLTPTWDYKSQKELIGVYKAMRTNIGPNASNMYIIETKNGEIGVWGTTLLDNRMPQIPVGNEVKLVYKGKEKNPKTNREYYAFSIYTKKA